MNLINKILVKIRQIQSEPEGVKIRYIWTSAIAIFIVFVAVWLIFLKANAPNAGNRASAPITDAKNNINDLKEKIKSSYGELKNNVLPEFKELLKDKEKTSETQVAPSSSSAVEENLK